MHLVYPPKFGITFVSNFSWILQSSQWFCKILGGKLWQSTLWSMRKCWVQLLSCEVWWKKLLIFFLGINRYLGNHSDFNWQTAGPRPHVSFLIWKRRFFFSTVWSTVHTYPVKTVTENVAFQKHSSEWRFWKTLKTEVFEYDDVVHHILPALRILCEGCYRVSIDSSTLLPRVDFFENGGENLRCQKLSGYLWTGAWESSTPARSLAGPHIGYLSTNPYQSNKVCFTSLDFAWLFFTLHLMLLTLVKATGLWWL